MTPAKRLTDIVLALVLGALLALPMLALTLVLWLGAGPPGISSLRTHAHTDAVLPSVQVSHDDGRAGR